MFETVTQEAPVEQRIDSRIADLSAIIMDIRRKMEGLAAENQRLRELVRISENELQSRRDQMKKMEMEIQTGQNNRSEAKARVENVMEQMDRLLANSSGM